MNTLVAKMVGLLHGVKAQSVYLSQYQLIPYNRVQEHFQEQLDLPISEGSIFTYNQQAYELLEQFEQKLIVKLLHTRVIHADETGININGKNRWLHCVSSPLWTLYYAHEKRGLEAMESLPLLTLFSGILVHDHWKPYFKLLCQHALCNAHHLRELAFAHEEEGQAWAKLMIDLLESILIRVIDMQKIRSTLTEKPISTAAFAVNEEPEQLHQGKRRLKESYTSHWDLDYLPRKEVDKILAEIQNRNP